MTNAADTASPLRITGSRGRTYTITRTTAGILHCTCPAFTYGSGEPCKHIRSISPVPATPCPTCGYLKCRCHWTQAQHDAEAARLFARCEESA